MDSVLAHLRARWQALGKWQEPVVFLGILAWWILSQWHYRWVPAYHDSLWQYYPATWIAEHRMWPFVASSDTGHPPLIAWCVGLLIFIGIPRLIAFHLYSWMIAAILAYAVWKTVRHYAGAVAGFAAVAVVVSLPLVVAQALQLTCDLSVAAFGMMICAYLATGKYWRAGIAGSLLALSKLPGIVSVSPVAGVLFLLLLLGKRKFNSPFTRGMAMAIILPCAVFVTFTIIKYLAVGYFFENGAFMEGKQMTLVTSLSAFGKRFASTLYTLTFRTGFLPLCAVLLASVAAYFASTHPPLRAAEHGGGDCRWAN
ncbi:glycosyltransferase family 39 protein [Candidatus Sumerlaeota bacterium]|nr:glycosyltransferase family 39 protein [Candidatus Sumerlaeota bacterium]